MATIRTQEILKDIPGVTETDLYIWIIKYQASLREMIKVSSDQDGLNIDLSNQLKKDVGRSVIDVQPLPFVRKLVYMLRRAEWFDDLMCSQERAIFQRQTRLTELRPEARIEIRLPGQTDILLEHISTHRWYLGERREAPVPYEEAVLSWYDHVYAPIINMIREQSVLELFPERTETDLYIWLIKRQRYLVQLAGKSLSMEEVVEDMKADSSKFPKVDE